MDSDDATNPHVYDDYQFFPILPSCYPLKTTAVREDCFLFNLFCPELGLWHRTDEFGWIYIGNMNMCEEMLSLDGRELKYWRDLSMSIISTLTSYHVIVEKSKIKCRHKFNYYAKKGHGYR